jgi:hypothetical protein
VLSVNASCPDFYVTTGRRVCLKRRERDKQIIGRHHGFVRDLCSAVCSSSGDVALNDDIVGG